MFYVPRISLAPLIVLITLPPCRAHCPLVWCQRCGERTTKVCCGQDNVYTASLPAAAAVSPPLIGQCPCRRRPIGREDDGSVWLAAGVPAASRIFVWIEDISQLLFEIFINVVCQTLGTRVWNLTHKLLRKMQYQLHWIQSSCEMLWDIMRQYYEKREHLNAVGNRECKWDQKMPKHQLIYFNEASEWVRKYLDISNIKNILTAWDITP